MDNRILEALYCTYRKEIMLYLFSICGNWAVAEDLQQEVFLKALLSIPKNYDNIRAWLYKIARNLCLNYMKQEKRIVFINNFLETEDLHVCGNDLLDIYIEKEQFRMLYKALLKLSTLKKEILELQYFGNFSLKEIAQLLNLSHENVRILKMRAKIDLKKILKEDGYEIS